MGTSLEGARRSFTVTLPRGAGLFASHPGSVATSRVLGRCGFLPPDFTKREATAPVLVSCSSAFSAKPVAEGEVNKRASCSRWSSPSGFPTPIGAFTRRRVPPADHPAPAPGQPPRPSLGRAGRDAQQTSSGPAVFSGGPILTVAHRNPHAGHQSPHKSQRPARGSTSPSQRPLFPFSFLPSPGWLPNREDVPGQAETSKRG